MKFENDRIRFVLEFEVKKKEHVTETEDVTKTEYVTETDHTSFVAKPGMTIKTAKQADESIGAQIPANKMAGNGKVLAACAAAVVLLLICGGMYKHFLSKDDSFVATMPENNKDEYVLAETETEEAGTEEGVEGTYLDASEIAEAAREKYEEDGQFDYGEPIYGIARNGNITKQIAYDPVELGIEDYRDMYALYKDADLMYPASCYYDRDEEKQEIYLIPPKIVDAQISTIGMDEGFVKEYDHSEYYLFQKDLNQNWGNIGTYYLATYRDEKTGEVLEKPIVQVVTVQGEISNTPKINFQPTENGLARFTWDKVEGAQEYLVMKIDKSEERGMNGSLIMIGKTTDTQWTIESAEYGINDTINTDFRAFKNSEDNGELEKAVNDYYYGVIAISKEGSSMLSNVYSLDELAPNLPYCYAMNISKEQEGSMRRGDSVELIPTHAWVTMCDGKSVRKLIYYDVEHAEVKKEQYFSMEDNEVTGSEDVQVLKIPYQIEGTPYSYEYTVMDYESTNMKQEMAYLKERQDGLRQKSGTLDFAREDGAVTEPKEGDTEIRQVSAANITANCALSEYLAAAMLGGASSIDIASFREARDTNFLQDALMEAYYQNPMIMGVSQYQLIGDCLVVSYENSPVEQAHKQIAIADAIERIIGEIITSDMTDLEKELAINEYLCDNLEYDYDALENAEQSDFQDVDESFYDSFNAYGALINHKCVCAGYSAAFKLLADAAGLDSIVVTGMLDGTTPHAWNKVRIEDSWMIVDSTNNDNEFIYNALLNIPDYASDRVLVEDKDFVLDRYIYRYAADNTEDEFYRVKDRYFSAKEIAGELVKELTENKTATLRTEYELDDTSFYEITDEVYAQMGDDIALSGGYWLGVIYLSAE